MSKPWSLLDVLGAAFEKNEVLDGWALRYVAYPDAEAASEAFRQNVVEASRFVGSQPSSSESPTAVLAEWPEQLRIARAGRLVHVYIWMGRGTLYWKWNDINWSNLDSEWGAIHALLGLPALPQ